MANLELSVPIATSSVFNAGSIAKQFTAMSILMLAQQGKLSLDDNVRKYIPEVPDCGEPITLRDLIFHTSGLRDFLRCWRWQAGVPGNWGDFLLSARFFDSFSNPEEMGSIVFTRDRKNRISGFVMRSGKIRNLTF